MTHPFNLPDPEGQAAPPATEPGVTAGALRALEWDINGSADVYSVRFSNGQGPKAFMVSRGSKIIAWCDDPNEAKAAAQADYEARVMSALKPGARVVTADQLREWALEWERTAEMARWYAGSVDARHIAAMRQIAGDKE